MNRGLAEEAGRAGELGLLARPPVVVEVRVDAVDRRGEAGRARPPRCASARTASRRGSPAEGRPERAGPGRSGRRRRVNG